MKNLPREVRGAMTILMCFFMESGALLYNGVGGPIFDSLGPASPFVLVSVFDIAVCAFSVLLACSGHLTIPNMLQVGNNASAQESNREASQEKEGGAIDLSSLIESSVAATNADS